MCGDAFVESGGELSGTDSEFFSCDDAGSGRGFVVSDALGDCCVVFLSACGGCFIESALRDGAGYCADFFESAVLRGLLVDGGSSRSAGVMDPDVVWRSGG